MNRFFLLTISFSILLGACKKTSDEVPPDEGGKLRDLSFSGPEGSIWNLVIQPDSNLLVAGSILVGNSHSSTVQRFSRDGVLDAGFNAEKDAWTNHETRGLSALNGGKVLLSGRYEVDGKIVAFLRFNEDGSLDRSYVQPAGITEPSSTATAPNGKIYVTGAYRYDNGYRRPFVIRLSADGVQEKSFQVGDEFSKVNRVLALADGKLLVMGAFTRHDEDFKQRIDIIRLDGELNLDKTFIANCHYFTRERFGDDLYGLLCAAVQPDGKIVVAGDFNAYQDLDLNVSERQSVDGVMRLNADGTLDRSFQTAQAPPSRGVPTDIEILEDNRILVTRQDDFNAPTVDQTVIYSPVGGLDNTFTLGSNQITSYGIQKQAAKTYLIWGGFRTRKGIWRLKF